MNDVLNELTQSPNTVFEQKQVERTAYTYRMMIFTFSLHKSKSSQVSAVKHWQAKL